MENEVFLTREWATRHTQKVDRKPLGPRYGLTFFREALVGCRSILDVGCGGAQLRQLLFQSNPEVVYYGVDFSPASLVEAKARCQDGYLIRADGAELPFADAHFDLAYQRDVILHHPQPLAMLKEMYRVGRKVLFNARVSPRLSSVLTLRNRRHSVLYQVLPYDGLFDDINSFSPPPAIVRFKFVDVSNTNHEQFEWYGSPHYCDLFDSGTQYHLHCLIVKGTSGDVPRFVDETTEKRVQPRCCMLPWHSVRRHARRLLFSMLGPEGFYRLRRSLRR